MDFVREQSWRRIEGICEKLKPTWVFPYAAGFRFRHVDLLPFNRMFFPVAEVTQRNLSGANPVVLEYGQRLGFLETPRTDWKSYREPAVEPLPRVDEGDVDVAFIIERSEQLKKSYLEMLEREARAWVSKITIELVVEEVGQGSFRLGYYFDGNQVQCVEIGERFKPDLVVKYSPAILRKVLSGEWAYHNAHYSYRCRADVKRIVSGQISVHRWA